MKKYAVSELMIEEIVKCLDKGYTVLWWKKYNHIYVRKGNRLYELWEDDCIECIYEPQGKFKTAGIISNNPNHRYYGHYDDSEGCWCWTVYEEIHDIEQLVSSKILYID